MAPECPPGDVREVKLADRPAVVLAHPGGRILVPVPRQLRQAFAKVVAAAPGEFPEEARSPVGAEVLEGVLKLGARHRAAVSPECRVKPG